MTLKKEHLLVLVKKKRGILRNLEKPQRFEVFRGWGFNFQKNLRFFEAESWKFFEVFWGFTLEKPQNSRWGWGQQFWGWGSRFEVFLRFWLWGFFEEKPQKTSNFEVRMRATFLRFFTTLIYTLWFLQNKLCFICKKTLLHFSSRFDVWHHGRRLANGLIKPMLRWTPGVFITPGTYHTSKIKYMFCDVKFCARFQIRRDYLHPYMFMYRNIFFCGPPLWVEKLAKICPNAWASLGQSTMLFQRKSEFIWHG